MTNQVLSDQRETINTKIRRLFAGNAFNVSWKTEEGSLIADNAIFGIVLYTGPVETFINYDAVVGGDSELLLYEAPTIGTTGTALTIYNANRTTPGRGSQFLAWHSPSNVTGTVINDQMKTATVDNSPEELPWVLTTGTFYAIIGVNRSGGSEIASVNARWYETDGET